MVDRGYGPTADRRVRPRRRIGGGPYAPPVLFDVTIDELGGWSVARVVGDVDLATMPALRSALDRTNPAAVVLDLRGAGLVDPLALGVVLSGRLRSTRRGGRFVVCCPPGPVRDLFEELGLDSTLELVDRPEDLLG